ncbi:hypothetical protein F53441_10611 [Fusarium austroafricanum]|uniref:C2H2-type domain-containing protein n=1 Tax=Fusarium austroafricanum TaxID=2364996 RepID=A0A8H4K8E0_9HYPO|nr:hypothetical protein F53441_10611 [Fusarium austroafricanum]
MSTADGLLASLVYVEETLSIPVTNHQPYAHKFWGTILGLRAEIESYWQCLLIIAREKDAPGLNGLLNSFPSPVHFYEAAIFTFRDVLTGIRPNSLDKTFALCSLSYVTSSYRHRTGKPDHFNIFLDISSWRDGIHDLEHRQTFSSLIDQLWSHATNPSFPILHPLTPIPELINPPAHENEALSQDDLFAFLDPFWGKLVTVPEPLQQPTVGDVELHSPDLPDLSDLEHSAVVAILIDFTKDCGELMNILSGNRLSTKPLSSNSSPEIKAKKLIQSLQGDDSFKDPSFLGILAIADRFVHLCHLRSIGEIQEYMIIAGRAIIPDDKTFVRFCQSVCASASVSAIGVAVSVGRRNPRAGLSAKPKKIPCDVCKEEFTRRGNMERHKLRKHKRRR